MTSTTRISPRRLGVLLLFMSLCALALVFRIGQLQIVRHDEFVQLANENHRGRQSIPAPRGAIKDAAGYPLAISVGRWEVSLDLANLRTPLRRKRAIAAVAAAMGIPPQQVEDKLPPISGPPRQTGTRLLSPGMVLITNSLGYPQGKALAELGLPGVLLQERTQRKYPEGSLAASLLGFIGKDGSGLTGIEEDFDRYLAGMPGTLVFERDSRGNPIPLGDRSVTHPTAGGDLQLTIDRYIQRVVERELDAAIQLNEAEGGTVIVMDPRTGAILAMASRPTFDLRNPQFNNPASEDLFRNRAITDVYEPGSTFKLITMAAALDEGLVTPQTTYFDGGPVIKYGHVIDTWDYRHYGMETMTELLIHSNNIGATWLSDLLGTDRFYPYLSKFGYGQRTNVGLSGEADGQLRTPKDTGQWWPIDLATNAFGQGLSVTPLQMATAVSAIVNGGTLMRPYVVQRVEGPEGVRTFQPTKVRQVISPETSSTLRTMMHAVIEQGGSTQVRVPGFRIGGKSGTASVPGPDGRYLEGTYIASYVGFAPYENPKAVVLVKIDRPKGSPWGSVVAGPVFSAVVREMLVYWRVPPSDAVLVANIR